MTLIELHWLFVLWICDAGLSDSIAFAVNFLGLIFQKGKTSLSSFLKRAIAKMVFCDDKGSNLLTRRLHSGHYQRLLMSADGKATKPLSVIELERYLDGLAIEVTRNNLLKN